MEKEIKYPIGAEHYTLYEEVGTAASASVHRALCDSLNEVVAVKILDFERDNVNLNNIFRESQIMMLVDHPNVLKSHCSFVNDHTLWVVMPYMAGGSCLHILKAAHPDGFEEVVIATILREVLKGLDYLHQHGHLHRDVKAGNVLIDSRGAIKLGDFGVSVCLFDSGDRQRSRNTFVGTPCWMAPEVMEQLYGYDFKADIWSFGITALELAHGHAPFSKYPPMKVLMMTLQNAPPGLDYERDKKFSKSFKHMIATCLEKDPFKRPTAKKLLRHSFFKQARSNDYIARRLLEGLPTLGDRLEALKRKEEDMLAQKKIPDGQKEEISQNEYNRGISGWDFNLDDIKAQASLIQDDDLIAEKDEDMLAKQLQHQSSMSRNTPLLQPQMSFASIYYEASDSGDNTHASNSIADSTGNINRVQSQSQIMPRDAVTNLQTLDIPQSDLFKGAKILINGEEVDEKAKSPVVQQKGRFKVTSENVEMEKASPLLQKSQSMQVIGQYPANSTPLPSYATQSNSCGYAVYPSLQSILQTNILQRDKVISAMKQVVSSDFSGCMPMSTEMAEVSLIEATNEREKELLREITDLLWRLICAQEELQKYNTDNSQVNS